MVQLWKEATHSQKERLQVWQMFCFFQPIIWNKGKGNEAENAINMLRARHSFRKRRSSISKHPKISVTNELLQEQLIPPPAPSPSAIRILEDLERSRTGSVESSRTGSPPDGDGKRIQSVVVSPDKIQSQQQSNRRTEKMMQKYEPNKEPRRNGGGGKKLWLQTFESHLLWKIIINNKADI